MTRSGRLLLMAGLTFHSGKRLADHPELIKEIEAEAATQERKRIRAAVKEIADDPALDGVMGLGFDAIYTILSEPTTAAQEREDAAYGPLEEGLDR